MCWRACLYSGLAPGDCRVSRHAGVYPTCPCTLECARTDTRVQSRACAHAHINAHAVRHTHRVFECSADASAAVPASPILLSCNRSSLSWQVAACSHAYMRVPVSAHEGIGCMRTHLLPRRLHTQRVSSDTLNPHRASSSRQPDTASIRTHHSQRARSPHRKGPAQSGQRPCRQCHPVQDTVCERTDAHPQAPSRSCPRPLSMPA